VEKWRRSLTVVVAALAATSCSAPDFQVGNSACHNGVKDWNETDIDCGGPFACDRCPDDDACQSGSDCLSENCVDKFCRAANMGAGGASVIGGTGSNGATSGYNAGGTGAATASTTGGTSFFGVGGETSIAAGGSKAFGGSPSTGGTCPHPPRCGTG